MKILRFKKSNNDSYFEYDIDGNVETIDYNPPIDDIDETISPDEYAVELLINPFLNAQSDIYSLCIKKGSDQCDRQTIGTVFSVSSLDSDQTLRKGVGQFFYIAFYTLLSRLSSLKDNADFSANFEPNICVCVIKKSLAGTNNPLHLCIHSLRMYGYDYFENNNHVVRVQDYDKYLFLDSGRTLNINVKLCEPVLYGHPIIDRILRDLKYANNVTHRFVLLYQAVEFLMEDAIVDDIHKIYNDLITNKIAPNDYFDDVSRVSKEAARIKNIFDECNIDSSDYREFQTACKDLLISTGFTEEAKKDGSRLFYAFRNKMTHSYRKLYVEQAKMALTIQHFEHLVFLIIDRYPRMIGTVE